MAERESLQQAATQAAATSEAKLAAAAAELKAAQQAAAEAAAASGAKLAAASEQAEALASQLAAVQEEFQLLAQVKWGRIGDPD